MDILSLKIDNFLAIGDAPKISLKDQGLVLVQGVNEDDTSATSNGVGKSSIVDALCWAVYGETARGISGDLVVNKVAKKNCSVDVFLQDGATFYKITRYRKDKEFKNSTVVQSASEEGALWVDMSKGTEKETQELINGIMGCSLDVFMASIYAGQEAMPDLPKMTDKQLKLLIEEASGVERLEVAYEIARKKMGSAKDALTIAEAARSGTLKSLESSKLDTAKKGLDHEAFEAGRDGRAKVFKDNANAHKAVLVRYLTAMKGVDTVALSERSSELGKQLAGHSDLLKQRDERKRRLADAVRKSDSGKMTLASMSDNAKMLKTSFDNAGDENAKPCPNCGKPGNEHDLESYKAHVKIRLVEALLKLKEQTAAVATLTDMVTTIESDLAAFEKTIPDVSILTTEQWEINEKLRAYASTKLEATKQRSEMDRQNEFAASAMTETNPHASAIAMLAERATKLESVLVEDGKCCAKAQNNLELFENVAKVFGPAGVRAHILDTVTPFLNDRTANYLSALSDGNINAVWTTLSTTAKGDLKEKFCIETSNDKGSESFAGLSGGEKRKVRLSTMLALQDLVSSRASKPINLWLGDEIDDALDSAGLERLMGILERKARERGTVLVISHNSLSDWIDQVVTVTKRSGVSTIEGALCM